MTKHSLKSCAVLTTRFLKYVRRFFIIMHGKVNLYLLITHNHASKPKDKREKGKREQQVWSIRIRKTLLKNDTIK